MTVANRKRVIIVTGGSEGIGFATCRKLVEEGAHVVMCARREETLAAAAAQLGGMTGSVETKSLDVADSDGLVAFIHDVGRRHGRLDGLVNNAFVSSHSAIAELSLDAWRHLYAVNVEAPFLATKAALEVMRPFGRGSIVNVASVSGLRARANASAYCSSKAALIQFSRAAALEAGPYGIRVNSVIPGSTHSASFDKAFAHVPPDEMAQLEKSASALGRFGLSEDVAEAIFFLLSDAARFVTGSEMHADGGAWLVR